MTSTCPAGGAMSTSLSSPVAGFATRRPPGRLMVHALIAGASFIAYTLARLTEDPAATVLAAFGVSACGWAWLLARALFDPRPRDVLWPQLVVAALTVAGAISVLAPGGGLSAGVATNVYVLSGSAALLLTLIEPFQRHGCELTPMEVRFRVAFTAGFALLAGVSVLGVWLDPQPVQTVSAVLSLAGAGAAVGFRLRHPLRTATSNPTIKPVTDEERHLATRLERLLTEKALYADPDLRIGAVAARLGEPEHRISRAVGVLGFANFNRLINHHRIEQARASLAHPDEARSILEIALDCGFASVGPFNRAFKAETGVTPRAYRAAALRATR